MSAFQSGAQAVFDKIGALMMQAPSIILEAPQADGNGLLDFLENFTASVADTFNKMKETAGAAITNVVVNVKERIGGVWNNLKESANGIWNNIKENAGNIYSNVKETFANVVSSVKERISGVWNNLKESAGNIYSNVKETFSNVVSSVKERISGVWNNLKESAGNVFSNVKETFTNVKESLGGIFHNEATSEIQEATLQPAVSEIPSGLRPKLQTKAKTDEVNIEPIQPTAAEQAATGNRIQRMFQKFCDKVEIILPQGTPEEQADILLNELMRRINHAVA